MSALINLSGSRFGKLVAVEIVGSKSRSPVWRCTCDCGATKDVRSANLRSGRVKSCGCLLKKSKGQTTHGHAAGRGSRTYSTWLSMFKRCTNPNDNGYAAYGGRGIRICERWHVFENFLADMGERPCGTSIDRIDGGGNYEPGNCRWATYREQNLNKKRSRELSAMSASVQEARNCGATIDSIKRRFGISYGTVTRLLAAGGGKP